MGNRANSKLYKWLLYGGPVIAAVGIVLLAAAGRPTNGLFTIGLVLVFAAAIVFIWGWLEFALTVSRRRKV